MNGIKRSNEYRKLNIIKKLKEHKERDKITFLLNDFNKKQENDFFLTQSYIRLGKLKPINIHHNDKSQSLGPYSYEGFHHIRRSSAIRQTRYRNTNTSLSTSRLVVRQRRDSVHINKNNIIDNKSLKNYYNDIRQRILENKAKNEEKDQLLTEVPYGVKKSLINQEKIFKKVIKDKKVKQIIQEKIKKKCKKKNLTDLLINKIKIFDKKKQELSIIDKNMTDDNKYRDNLWNISLRNIPYNGKYEKVGYLNVGSKEHPMYTYFNINKNIEYFNKPNHGRNKTEENKIINHKIFSSLNENNYETKMKQNLQLLNSIKSLEINGKNLLDVEDKRESEIKGKKILYSKHDLDCMLFRSKDKTKKDKELTDIEFKLTLDEIYEDKIFAKNYRKKDVFKNINLTSKYSNNI